MRNRNEIMVKSGTGEVMRALYDSEADGSFSVVIEDKHGFASVHLKLARTALGGKIQKVIDHAWVTKDGTKARLSVYRTVQQRTDVTDFVLYAA